MYVQDNLEEMMQCAISLQLTMNNTIEFPSRAGWTVLKDVKYHCEKMKMLFFKKTNKKKICSGFPVRQRKEPDSDTDKPQTSSCRDHCVHR